MLLGFSLISLSAFWWTLLQMKLLKIISPVLRVAAMRVSVDALTSFANTPTTQWAGAIFIRYVSKKATYSHR